MQGLGQAQGFTSQLQSLYNSLYSPGGGMPAAGGVPVGAPPAASGTGGQGMTLGSLSQFQPPKPKGPGHGAGGAWR